MWYVTLTIGRRQDTYNALQLSLPWFRRLRKPTFRKVFTSKFRAYFKITVMPDVVSGTMEDTLWIRSARGCKIEVGIPFCAALAFVDCCTGSKLLEYSS